jgi:hypothetical protein
MTIQLANIYNQSTIFIHNHHEFSKTNKRTVCIIYSDNL